MALALPDVIGTKIGCLVIAEFADPARLRALGPAKLIRFAGNRGLQLRRHVAEKLVAAAEAQLATLLPDSHFATLTTVPGWGLVRVANYVGALDDPQRWPGPRQVYRASGLSPMQY